MLWLCAVRVRFCAFLRVSARPPIFCGVAACGCVVLWRVVWCGVSVVGLGGASGKPVANQRQTCGKPVATCVVCGGCAVCCVLWVSWRVCVAVWQLIMQLIACRASDQEEWFVPLVL